MKNFHWFDKMNLFVIVTLLSIGVFFEIAKGDEQRTNRIIENPVSDGDLIFRINDGGVKRNPIVVTGATTDVTMNGTSGTLQWLFGSNQLKISAPNNSTPLFEIDGAGTAKRMSLKTSAAEIFSVNSSGQVSALASGDAAIINKSSAGNAYFEANAFTGSTPQIRLKINDATRGFLRATTTNSLEVFDSTGSSPMITVNGSTGLTTFTGSVSGASSTALVSPNGVLASADGGGQWRAFISTSTADDGNEIWTIPASNWVELSMGTGGTSGSGGANQNFFGFARGGSWVTSIHTGSEVQTFTSDVGLGGVTDGQIGICFVSSTQIKVYNRTGAAVSFTAHVRLR